MEASVSDASEQFYAGAFHPHVDSCAAVKSPDEKMRSCTTLESLHRAMGEEIQAGWGGTGTHLT
jgi:hypothetical protein